MPEDDGFWTMEGPGASLDVHTCPECRYTAIAEHVREAGGCLLDRCDWTLEEASADA